MRMKSCLQTIVLLWMIPALLGCSGDGQDTQLPPSADDTAASAEAGANVREPSHPRKVVSFDDEFLSREDLIAACEVVLRAVPEKTNIKTYPDIQRYFLEVFTKSPPAELLEAFKDDGIPFASPFVFDPSFKGGNFNGTRYVEDNKYSVFFDIFSIEHTGTDQLYINCSVVFKPLSARHHMCIVEKNDGAWEVHSIKTFNLL